MTGITYTPSGTSSYTCELTTDSGLTLVIRGDDEGAVPKADGDEALRKNPAILNLLRAYGLHEWSYRRLRSPEKRKSHQIEATRYRREALALAPMIESLDSDTCTGWCSACMTRSQHRYVQGMSRPTKTYLCKTCGSPTTVCAVPQCSNLANRGVGKVTTPRYCAEHRHEIPSFGKLEQRLERLDDYESWLTFEKHNAKRTTTIASIGVVGGAVVAPVAFIAAPAIGGAIGAFGGLSGAAATGHGLALLGGGSLAAGGLGMVGGTTVVTALGGALGTTLGATVTAEYARSDPSFRIQKLADGEDTPVLFATGFLTQGADGWGGGWEKLITERYPHSPVYRVHWGAKELRALGTLLGIGLGQQAAKAAMLKLAAKASKKAAKQFGPLGTMLSASGLLRNPWSVARTRAEMTGAVLADLIARTDQDRFVLLGHSLGGRVMVTAAQALGTKDDPKIEAMHLLGAAVSQGGDWRTLNDAVIDGVWNYRSMKDQVLAKAYKAAELGSPAVGRVGFESKFRKIRDRNVTQQVSSHTQYVKKIRLVNANGR